MTSLFVFFHTSKVAIIQAKAFTISFISICPLEYIYVLIVMMFERRMRANTAMPENCYANVTNPL